MRIFGKDKKTSSLETLEPGQDKEGKNRAGRKVSKLFKKIRQAGHFWVKTPVSASSALMERTPSKPVSAKQQSQVKTLSGFVAVAGAGNNPVVGRPPFGLKSEPDSPVKTLPTSSVPASSGYAASLVTATLPERQNSQSASDISTAAATAGSDKSDVAEFSGIGNLESVENLDADTFLEEYVLPQVKQAKRNPAEHMIGWFAERFLQKHLPVDNELSAEHRRNLGELKEQIHANKKSLETLSKERKGLEKVVEKNRKSIQALQSSLGTVVGDIADTEEKLKTNPGSDKARKKLARLKQQHSGQAEKLARQIKIQTGVEARIDVAMERISEFEEQIEFLVSQQKRERETLNEVKAQQDVFNRQIVSLALNLRRIYQGKVALGAIHMPQLKIPMGDLSLNLHQVRFRPANIETRTDADGQPLVDITLKDIRAAMELPVEAGVFTDLDVNIDDIKFTLGGPIAKAIKNYLDGSSAKVGINIGYLLSEVTKALRGENTEAPVHMGVEVGTVTVNTNTTNAETIAKVIAKMRRTPDSGLHEVIANLRLPVSLAVKEANVHAGELEPGDPELESDEVMKLNARIQDLHINFLPDVDEVMGNHQRHARLAVHAGHAHVDVNTPVGLAVGTAQHLLPGDPLKNLPHPPGAFDDLRFLDHLPGTLSSDAAIDLDDVNVVLDRNVNKRTTEASPDKPVWFVEGDAISDVKAGKMVVSTVGDINGAGTVYKSHLCTMDGDGQQRVYAGASAPDGSGRVTGRLAASTGSGLIKSLARISGNDELMQWLVQGAGSITINGDVQMQIEKKSQSLQMAVDGVQVDIRDAIRIRKGDTTVFLPGTVSGRIKGLSVENSPVQEYRGNKIQRTDFNVEQIRLAGEGDIVISTQSLEGGSAENKVILPVKSNNNTLSNVRLESIQLMSSDGEAVRRRVVVHPGQLVMRDISMQGGGVDKIRMSLDDELNGKMKIKGARFSFNELLSGNENLPKLSAPLRWLLKNKTVALDGMLAVRKGSVDPRQIAASRLRVEPDKERASLFDRLACRVINVVLRSVLTVASGNVIHFDRNRNQLVLRLPFLPKFSIPLPKYLTQSVVVSDRGTIDLGATQFKASGIYCLPRSRQRELDHILEQIFIGEQSAPQLDALITDAEESIKHTATGQEVLYLLHGLPVERLVTLAKDDEGICSALRRIVKLALQDPRSHSVALDIFNRGLSLRLGPDPEQLQTLIEVTRPEDANATDLALLLCRLSRVSLAHPLLVEIVEHNPFDLRAQSQLARIEWSAGRYSQALGRISHTAYAAKSPKEKEQMIQLLNHWVRGEDDQNSEHALKARLLQATLLIRGDVQDGHADMLLEGVRELEALAQVDDEFGTAAAALVQLKKRCDDAARIHEDLALEPWEAWRNRVDIALDNLKKGKALELSGKERYLAALGLMYGYRGIDPHLQYALNLFRTIEPLPEGAGAHLRVLEAILSGQYVER